MDTKDLYSFVANIHAKYPHKDAWAIYYQIIHTDDSVNQRRVAAALKKILKQEKEDAKKSLQPQEPYQNESSLPAQYSAKKYDP